VVLHLLTDLPERFRSLTRIWLGENDQSAIEVTVERAAIEQRGVRLKLSTLNSRDDAERVRGQLLFVESKNAVRLPKGRYFIHDIIGMTVCDEEGQRLGTVDDVLQYPANHVYVVRDHGREILIPAVKEFVRSVDLEGRTMVVRLIDGMMEA
jgi:16S rRNA processing protein RimM